MSLTIAPWQILNLKLLRSLVTVNAAHIVFEALPPDSKLVTVFGI